MGFGYLLIGYLVTFVLYLTLAQLELGALALIVGYLLMLIGLYELLQYEGSFSLCFFSVIPLIVTALYDLLCMMSTAFAWFLPICGSAVVNVFDWVTFLCMIFFHGAMLSAIRKLAMDVELRHIATKAVRNFVFVGLYAVIYLVAAMPVSKSILPYLNVALMLTQVVFVICNLLLLLSCTKNICPSGEEEGAPQKRYRWELLNKIGDAFERTQQKNRDYAKDAAERRMTAKKEKREARSSRKKKK